MINETMINETMINEIMINETMINETMVSISETMIRPGPGNSLGWIPEFPLQPKKRTNAYTLEFWTSPIANSDHTDRFGPFTAIIGFYSLHLKD